MLISCPSCKTNFSVPAKAIGEAGKKVKCTKCSNIWFQEPIKVDKEKLDSLLKSKDIVKKEPVPKKSEENSDSDSNENLPAKIDKSVQYYVLGILVFLTLSLVIQIFKEPEIYKNYSDMLSLKSYNQLRMTDFKVESEVIDNKVDFFITGKIFNTSNAPVEAPTLSIKILSSGGRVMNEASFSPQDSVVPSNGFIEIAPEITGVSGNADKVSLSFGSWFEQSFN